MRALLVSGAFLALPVALGPLVFPLYTEANGAYVAGFTTFVADGIFVFTRFAFMIIPALKANPGIF